jgi:hypothetical protein
MTTAPATPLQPIPEKLTRVNFPVWKALVLSALRGAQLQEFLDDKVVLPPAEITLDDKKTKVLNPKHARMVARQQHVLNYLLSLLSHEMLLHAATCDTHAEVRVYITSSFESQSRAHMINVCMALSTTKKGDMPNSKYITKMKGLADEMTSARKRLDDEDLVSYILAGLDLDFDGVISVVSARVEPITVAELYGQLLSHEQHWELLQTNEYHAANVATNGGFGRGRGRGRRGCGDFGRGTGGQFGQEYTPNSCSDRQC